MSPTISAGREFTVPFNTAFYHDLIARRDRFQRVATHTVPAGRGYGFRVETGQAFRLIEVEEAQIVDTCIANADDPSEHYHAGTQVALEGMQITRLTRVWGTPPRSRPLGTCIADTVRPKPNALHMRDHLAFGAHCNPHLWTLYTGRHPRTCYDNLRAGFAMLGLSQHMIHDNMNLLEKAAFDPICGDPVAARGDAEAGDYIEFYAEIPLIVVVSLCPWGVGSIPIEEWGERHPPVYPLRVDVLETHVAPLGWPYGDGGHR